MSLKQLEHLWKGRESVTLSSHHWWPQWPLFSLSYIVSITQLMSWARFHRLNKYAQKKMMLKLVLTFVLMQKNKFSLVQLAPISPCICFKHYFCGILKKIRHPQYCIYRQKLTFKRVLPQSLKETEHCLPFYVFEGDKSTKKQHTWAVCSSLMLWPSHWGFIAKAFSAKNHDSHTHTIWQPN